MSGCSLASRWTLLGCFLLLPPMASVATAQTRPQQRPPEQLPRIQGPTTGAGSTMSGADVVIQDRWELWWLYNREPYLARHDLGEMAAPSDGGSFLVGRSGGHWRDPLGVTAGRVVDALIEATADPSQEVIEASLTAMARVAREPQQVAVRRVLQRHLRHPIRPVREAAVVALGILGHQGDEPALIAMLEGQAPQGGLATVQDQSLAAISLGLLDGPGAFDALGTMARRPDTPVELGSSCVLALGLLERDAPRAAWMLEELWNDARLERIVRAQVPVAIQRLPRSVGRTQVPWLLEALERRNVPAEFERSLVLALGGLGDVEDDEVILALRQRATGATDRMTRLFSTVSLARIFEGSFAQFATPDRLNAARLALPPVADTLSNALRDRARRPEQAFAALATGLLLRVTPDEVLDAQRERLTDSLVTQFDREREPSQRGAYAIALGLAGHEPATERLRDAWTDTQHFEFQGHAATALGLLGDRESAPAFRARLTDEGLPTALRLELTRALALVGDNATLAELVSMLGRSSNLVEASASALGLALVADARVSGPVLRILRDESAPDTRRTFSAVALGILAERDRLPWFLPLSIDANYTVPSRAWTGLVQTL